MSRLVHFTFEPAKGTFDWFTLPDHNSDLDTKLRGGTVCFRLERERERERELGKNGVSEMLLTHHVSNDRIEQSAETILSIESA